MAIQVSTIQVRGKIGNAVGYKRSGARRSGANFARVYTDVVRDPQTASQLYQRAIAATVSKAYAAMSRICDHSFQGSAVGAESMQRFYSLNLNQLRRDVMADLSDPVTDPVDMLGSVVAPRSAFPTCYPFIVSEGTLTNSFLRVSSIDAQLCVLFPAALSAAETVSGYIRRCGLVRGDIFTALGLGVLDPQGAFSSQYGQLASQPSTSFGFIRFKLKDAAFSDDSPVADAPVSQVFAVEYGGQATAFADDELPERAVFCDSITGGDDGFIGVIRSRRNSPLRSSCRLQGTLVDGTVSDESKYGIKSAFLLNAWLPEQDTLGQSSLILEGGGFPAPPHIPSVNDLVGQTFTVRTENNYDVIAQMMEDLGVTELPALLDEEYFVARVPSLGSQQVTIGYLPYQGASDRVTTLVYTQSDNQISVSDLSSIALSSSELSDMASGMQWSLEVTGYAGKPVAKFSM